MFVFQRVQTECGTLGLNECVRRFRALYKGKERYSDEALRLQFTALGVYNANTAARLPARRTDDQKQAVDEDLSRSGIQQLEQQDAVVLDDSDGEDESTNEEEPTEDTRLTYEPSSPVITSQPVTSVPLSPLFPASGNVSSSHAGVIEGKYADDSAAGHNHEEAGPPADIGAAVVRADPALVEAVAAALAVRRTRRAAAKRRREDEERETARQQWKLQCRKCAGTVGRTVYRGVTAMACGYGLVQAIATVFPSELEQAAMFTQQQLAALTGRM